MAPPSPLECPLAHDLLHILGDRLRGAGCQLVASPGTVAGDVEPREEEDVDVTTLGMAVVLGREPDDLALLRRCVNAGTPYISTPGAARGLLLALDEGRITLQPLASTAAASSLPPGAMATPVAR